MGDVAAKEAESHWLATAQLGLVSSTFSTLGSQLAATQLEGMPQSTVAIPGRDVISSAATSWMGTPRGRRRSIAIIAKGDSNMGIFTKDIKTMEDLLIHGLQDIYYAEQQIIKSLPKMIEKATNRDLATGLKAHLEETNKQVERLQKVFEKLGKEPSGTQCPAIDGIIKEADETAGEIEDKAVLDAALVAAAQAVEHYEMCRYGTLIAWAEELGHDEIVRFLTTNLNEEKAANTKLNTVALRKGVNAKASNAA
jgi:ferritin-like metal-binding protein YciE